MIKLIQGKNTNRFVYLTLNLSKSNCRLFTIMLLSRFLVHFVCCQLKLYFLMFKKKNRIILTFTVTGFLTNPQSTNFQSCRKLFYFLKDLTKLDHPKRISFVFIFNILKPYPTILFLAPEFDNKNNFLSCCLVSNKLLPYRFLLIKLREKRNTKTQLILIHCNGRTRPTRTYPNIATISFHRNETFTSVSNYCSLLLSNNYQSNYQSKLFVLTIAYTTLENDLLLGLMHYKSHTFIICFVSKRHQIKGLDTNLIS